MDRQFPIKNEEKLWNLVEHYSSQIVFVIITVLCFLIRCKALPFVSGDFTNYLGPWFEQLKQDGGLLGLKYYTGNYSMPYMTLVAITTYFGFNSLVFFKGISIIFDFICAFTGMKIIDQLSTTKWRSGLVVYTILLLSPAVILNSSFWAQCDIIYTAFLLLSIYSMLKNKDIFIYVYFGLALAFKLQAVFFLPFLLVYWFKQRRTSILYLLISPVTVFVANLPAILFGVSPAVMISTYVGQVSEYKVLVLDYPNIWYLFQITDYDLFNQIGIFFMLVFMILFCGLILNRKSKIAPKEIIPFAMWFIYTAVLFLPSMHERYAFALEVLSLVYVVYNKKHWWIAAVLNGIIINSYLLALYSYNIWNYSTLGLINLISYFAFSIFIYKDYFRSTRK